MKSEASVKPKRHKKRKSRTEVLSDSDSPPEKAPRRSKSLKAHSNHDPSPSSALAAPENGTLAKASKSTSQKNVTAKPDVSAKLPADSNATIDAAFKSYYMQRVAEEFADDLNAVRGADDFRDGALEVLLHALQQGTEMFGADEKRRVVGGDDDHGGS